MRYLREVYYIVSNYLPHQTANATLASLPLGSIKPYNNCLIVYICPGFSPALVPPILD